MNNRKNQNSIIVLATLGVYFGLVLAGATPQLLAQAAMTRQFDAKDEIEVKDDLDKKPDRPVVSDGVDESLETEALIADSVSRFLLKFEPTVPSEPFIATIDVPQHFAEALKYHELLSYPSHHVRGPLTKLVSVSNFAASLDPLLS